MPVKKGNVIQYGKFVIKAGLINKVPIARAFWSRKYETKGIAFEATGPDETSAILAVIAKIDQQQMAANSSRRKDPNTGVTIATTSEFEQALSAHKLSRVEKAMLKAHAAAGESGLTAGQLARAADYSSFEAANSQYGKLGRKFSEFLNIEPPAAKSRPGDVATCILATEGPKSHEDYFVWVMHPELAEAVRRAL